MHRKIVIAAALLLLIGSPISAQPLPFRNSALPTAARVNDLLTRLTLQEKISLLGYRSKAVDQIGRAHV